MAYRYTEMSRAQIDEFLLAPRIAVFGTSRANGSPQLSPVWYLYENERLYVGMFAESAKFRNMRRDPRVAICIAGEYPDARSVMIYGTVDLVLESSPWRDEISWRIVRRYHGSDEQAKSYMDSTYSGGEEVLAVVTPDKILAEDFN